MRIYTSNGQVTNYDNGDLNFNRERLLITLKGHDWLAGWHWDHLACILQNTVSLIESEHKNTCKLSLIFSSGQSEILSFQNFQAAELKMANSLVVIRGSKETAIVNPDFLNWYKLEAI
ncbi:hypothetical protein [Desulfonatronovibrio magnus]|uniref:hypothetical protein n=1 Tax=Desulfonatronovibrio magnus TaxID=698827 RepID=UPI0005EAE9F0|nr:hypothetical protein [Desulfonatronovibrio magnus]